MKTTISIDPITRISGFMEITLTVEDHKVIDAKCSGLLYRGFEKMLLGKDPKDAIYFTERICGICSAAHACASSEALEDLLKITPDLNRSLIRNILHSSEFLQNHIRHFYLYALPDYAPLPVAEPILEGGAFDFRFPEDINKNLNKHYIDAVKYSRMAHELQTIIGGKAPHTHGIFIGGGIANLTPSKIIQLKYIESRIKGFVEKEMLEDADLLGKYYSDYFSMGSSYKNLMSYGLFNDYKNIEPYVKPETFINGNFEPLNRENIKETTQNAWYEEIDGTENAKISEKGYTFVKTPRYNKKAMEVGPLARMYLSGKYRRGISSMDRLIARAHETLVICNYLESFIDMLEPDTSNVKNVEIIDGKGISLIDTTRGSLMHETTVKNELISSYNIITPSAWNCSPKDDEGVYGTVEKALIGTYINDEKNPIEAARIVRSFDPCISCAVH